MKTNQIFNFNRFGRYAQSALIMHYRQLLLIILGVSISLFLFILLTTNNSRVGQWGHEDWMGLFFGTGSIGGLLYIGYAFSPLRKKESTITYLLMPASTLEKFIYEFIEKVLLFLLLFPTIFYVFGNLAIEVSTALRQAMGLRTEMEPFTALVFSKFRPEEMRKIVISIGVLFSMLAFAGAATFRKHPLIKTVVFCGAVVAIVAGYFYVMIEKLHLRNPWMSNLDKYLNEQQSINLLTTVILAVSVIVLVFAYFKLKEKEVS